MKNLVSLLSLCIVAVLAIGQTRNNYTSQGRYELSRGRYTPAIELFNKSIALSQFNSEAYFLRGICKYELEDFIGSEKDFTSAIDLNPKNHEAFLYRGVSRSQLRKYKEAFQDFASAAKLNEEDSRIYANRSLASLQLDRYVDAISDCNKIIQLDKADSQTYLIRGEAKAGLEMHTVAIEDFERAIDLDSLNMRPILHRGIARTHLKEYQKAISDFEKAMELDKENALPKFHRAIAMSEMGDQKSALADLNEVLEQHPDNAIVLFNRAMVYTEMGKTALALADYDMVTRLSPKNILGFYNRGILLFNQRKYDLALTDLQSALSLFPEFIEAREMEIEIHLRNKNKRAYDQSMVVLDSIKSTLALSTDDAKLEQHIQLIKVTQLKGDFEPVHHEVGKVQHQKVDVKLLPIYRISSFPESDADISVYDGYKRPNYNTGAMAFTTNSKVDQDKARKQISTMNVRPDSPAETARLAALYCGTGNFEQAFDKVNSCLNNDFDNVVCLFSRALVNQLLLAKREEEYAQKVGALEISDPDHQAETEAILAATEADYRKVIELDPGMSFAHFNLGNLLASAERFEEAETQFGLAASSRGNFIEANYNRGLIRLLIGKMSKGCEDLSLAGELGFSDAYNIMKRYCE